MGKRTIKSQGLKAASAGSILWSALLLSTQAQVQKGADSDLVNPLKQIEGVEKTVGQWIEELTSKDFETRNAAESYLWQNGKKFSAELKKAMLSDHPEKKIRAMMLYEKVEADLLPTTDPKIVKLVGRIRNAEDEEEAHPLINQLEALGAGRQIIYLYSVHRVFEVKDLLLRSSRKLILNVARERILAGDVAMAKDLLTKLPIDQKVADALACIHHFEGTIEQRILQLASEGEQQGELMIALLKQKGDYESIKKIALAKRDRSLAARVELLLGDGQPLVDLVTDYSSFNPSVTLSANQVDGFALNDAVHRGDFSSAKKLMDQLSQRVRGERDANKMIEGLVPLLVNGSVSQFESSFNKMYIDFGDRYFSAVLASYASDGERPELLFGVTHAPTDPKKLKAWVSRTVAAAEKADPDEPFGEEAESDIRRLFVMAELFDAKGAKEEVRVILEGLLGRTRELKADAFPTLANRCVDRGLAWYISELIPQLTVDEVETLDEVLFIGRDDLEPVVEWIAKQSVGEGKAGERLQKILVVTGTVKLNKHWNADELHAQMLKQALELKDKKAQQLFLSALYGCAYSRGDVEATVDLVDRLHQAGSEDRFDAYHFELLKGLGRWAEIDKRLSAYEKTGGLKMYHFLHWSLALRQLGKAEQAAEKIKMLKLLYLNEPGYLYQLAANLNAIGEQQEVQKLVERLQLSYKLESSAYNGLISWLTTLNGIYANDDNWQKASEISRASKYLSVLHTNSLVGRGDFAPRRSLALHHQYNLTRSMAQLKTDRGYAVKLLQTSLDSALLGGDLADAFLPQIEKAGLTELHGEFFGSMFGQFEKSLKRYPKSANTYNSAAWVAARCGYRLDQAERYSTMSLKYAPYSSAYRDTLAEVAFAKGDRETAIKVSNMSLKDALSGKAQNSGNTTRGISNFSSLILQKQHYLNDPLPKLKQDPASR